MAVEFFRHSLEAEDIDALKEVVGSVFLTTGPVTAKFEQKFAEHTSLPHIVGTNSCTAALHLALLALDIGPGDEVITTPMTFVATALAILHTGAHPVFADVDPSTGLIDPEQVERAVTRRTKAILPVHLYGAMADMRALRDIADRHHLSIVEDAAHCIEGERDGVHPGELGDAVCYSFYATKNLTCGEGGAVGTRFEPLAKRIRSLRLHGMTADAASRYGGKFSHWDVTEPGWKYNMDSLHASLLIHQMDRLSDNLTRRQVLTEQYHHQLNSIDKIELPSIPGNSAYHLLTIWLPPEQRDIVAGELRERGIGVGVNYRAVHTLDYFQRTYGYAPDDFPIANKIGQRTLSLPLYPKLQPSEVSEVVDELQAITNSLECEGSPSPSFEPACRCPLMNSKPSRT